MNEAKTINGFFWKRCIYGEYREYQKDANKIQNPLFKQEHGKNGILLMNSDHLFVVIIVV